MNGLTLRQIGLLTAVGALLAIGQVLFKLAAKSTQPVIDFTSLVKLIINPIALPAVGIYFFTTVLWLYLLQQVPLSSLSVYDGAWPCAGSTSWRHSIRRINSWATHHRHCGRSLNPEFSPGTDRYR